MRRLIIAVDCDDVLVLTTPFFVDAYNKKYGTNIALADALSADPAIWGAEEPVVVSRWQELTQTDEYEALSPDPREAAILKELAKHHELHLITARNAHERAATQKMLDQKLEGVFNSMEFVGWGGSKGEVCQRIGADVLVDDKASNLYDAIQQGTPKDGALLFGDYVWTRDDNKDTPFVHCKDWPSVKKKIEELANG